jgi:hypothetical protein
MNINKFTIKSQEITFTAISSGLRTTANRERTFVQSNAEVDENVTPF